VTAFLVGSGVVFWVIALPILCLVTVAVVRGVKDIRANRRTVDHLVEVGTGEIEQYLQERRAS